MKSDQLARQLIASVEAMGVNPEPLDLQPYIISTVESRAVREARSRAAKRGAADAAHRQFLSDPIMLAAND